MREIPEVSDAELSFPSNANRLLPAWDDLPEEYRKGWTGAAPGCDMSEGLFFNGGKLPSTKEGVDATKASRVIQACLGSFDLSHEHKIAGVGFLLNEWFNL